MNKKITLVILLAIIGTIIFGFIEYFSYRTVAIEFIKPDLSITIYNSTDNKITSLDKNENIKVKEGSYYYIPTSDSFNSDKVYFLVTNNNSVVEINPAYSNTRLSTLLDKEGSKIHSSLTSKYPAIVGGYVIGDEKLYNHGDWYSARLIQRPQGTDEPDIYRVILKKDNNVWKVVVSPRLIISVQDFPEIPTSYIKSVNEPLSSTAYSLLYL